MTSALRGSVYLIDSYPLEGSEVGGLVQNRYCYLERTTTTSLQTLFMTRQGSFPCVMFNPGKHWTCRVRGRGYLLVPVYLEVNIPGH